MTSADGFRPPPDDVLVVAAARQNAGRPVRRLLDLARQGRLETDARIHLGGPDLSRADPAAARRTVDEHGSGRVWVLVAAAPLGSQLLRLWQEAVLDGATTAYDEWLAAALDGPGAGPLALEERLGVWVEAVGCARVLLVIDDPQAEADTGLRLEELTRLPVGSLAAGPEPDHHARDLTWSETELVRATNEALAGPGWDGGIDRLTVRAAVVEGLRSQPGVSKSPHPAALPVPVGAVEQVRDRAARDRAAVDRHGVAVLGDPRCLGEVAADPLRPEEADLPVTGAAAAIQRAIEAGLDLTAGQAARDRRTP